MYDKILSFIKKDYWKMSESELVDLANRYNLLDEPKLERIALGLELDQINPNYERNLLSQEDRDGIIHKLLLREKYVRDYVAVILSILAFIISIISLILSSRS